MLTHFLSPMQEMFRRVMQRSGLIVLSVMLLLPAASFAAPGDAVLDGIETFVEGTGLGEIRDNLSKEYGVYFQPYLKTRYDLTGNVFKSPEQKTDNVWTIAPGFEAVHKSALGVIGLAYEAAFRYFSEYDNQNTQDQHLLVYANLKPTEETYLRVSERLENRGATSGSQMFEDIDYTDNTLDAAFGVHQGRFTHELAYQNFDRDFHETLAKRYGYNENRYDYRLYYGVNENVRVWSGVRFGLVDFDKINNRDTNYYELPLGIEAALPYETLLLASVGVHHRNLEADGRNDLTLFVTNIKLQKTFNRKRTAAEFGFLRRPVESTFSTATTYDEKLWYGEVKHLLNRKLRARASIMAGNQDYEERVFTGSRVIVGGAVFVTTPNQVKRSDNLFGWGVGLDYSVRSWLVLHGDYQYTRRDSNIAALDYTEHVLSLRSSIPL